MSFESVDFGASRGHLDFWVDLDCLSKCGVDMTILFNVISHFLLSLSLSHSAAHVFRLLLDSNEVEQNSVINQNWLDNEILCEFPAKCLRALALEFTTCHMSPGDIVYHK